MDSVNSARTTPLGLLVSGIGLLAFGLLMQFMNAGLQAFPPIWAWMVVGLGAGMAVVAFIWAANLSEETKRHLMAMPRSTRRMYWPFLKKLQFFPDDELMMEMERLKHAAHVDLSVPPVTPGEEKNQAEKKEEVFIPPLQD